jgi:molybdenum cofactor cytidylyltransferase
VVVVTGHDAEGVRAALAGRTVEFAHNPDHAGGMSSSLRVGLDAIGDKVDGALICLGDMPWVRAEHVEALVSAFDPNADRAICVPVHDRKRGNPVLWPARHFAEMRRLEGDRGARDLLSRYGEEISYVPVADEGVNLDVDTPETLRSLAGRLASRTEGHED